MTEINLYLPFQIIINTLLKDNSCSTTLDFITITPTDHPRSVRNRCVIEVFGGDFVLSRCFLDFSVCIGVFVIGLSQISFFFSYCNKLT